MKLSQFKFKLPEDKIALYPAKYRDESRLMVVHKSTGKIEHKVFKDILDYFDDKDVFIFNDTKVFPARLYGNKEKTGARIEVFLLRELNEEFHLWDVLVDPARKIRIGNKLYFGEDDSMVAEVIDNTTSRGRTLRFLYEGSHDEFKKALYALGEAPLPGFIRRPVEEEDAERFQTIFAKNEGAVTAPTAGLHFSRELMKRMEIKGIDFAFVTMHAGLRFTADFPKAFAAIWHILRRGRKENRFVREKIIAKKGEKHGMGYKILIADDEAEIRDLLRLYLEKDGYEVIEAADGAQTLSALQEAALQKKSVDLVILDIMMPGIDGYRVLRNIRENSNIPVIMLSAKSDDADKILGLDLGADDYITKPFRPLEAVARVNSNIRRFYALGSGGTKQVEELSVRDLKLDLQSCLLYQGERSIELTSIEYRLMKLFMENPGKVFTKQQLFEEGWGDDYLVSDNNIMVCISKLRAKLCEDGNAYIRTIRGLGYRLEKDREKE